MANVNSLTVGDTTLPVANSLASLSDVSAPSPAAGQVLTFGDGGVWSPQSFHANGFPGLDALDWQDPLNLGMKKGDLVIIGGSFEIAKFQNQVFFRMTDVQLTSNIIVGTWRPIFTSVPNEWLPNKNNMLGIAQTTGGSLVAICAGNDPSTIWLAPIVWNSGGNNLHGIVTWYV